MFFHDSHHEVRADGNPDLRLHRIRLRSPEAPNLQMSLDPSKELFNIPAVFIEVGDLRCGQLGVVCEIDIRCVCLCIVILHSSEILRILLSCCVERKPDGLITTYAACPIDRVGIQTNEAEILFCTNDEGCMGLVNCVQSAIINVAAIHDVAGTRFNRQCIKDIHIVYSAIGNVHKDRDISTKIKKCMEFHRALCLSKVRPAKDRETQINRRRIERVEDAVQIIKKRGVGAVQQSRLLDEEMTECLVDSPVALF